MLRRLSLRDFVIVDELEVEFGAGFSVLTGETGAGKSILIDALQLALGARGDVLVLCHGGPIATPADAEHVLRRCDRIHGFYGASSMERLPVEQALKAQTEQFKAVTFA